MLFLRMFTILTSSPCVGFGLSTKKTLKPYVFGIQRVLESPINTNKKYLKLYQCNSSRYTQTSFVTLYNLPIWHVYVAYVHA